MKPSFKRLLIPFAVIATAGPASAQTGTVQYLNQGWDDPARQAFYTTTQGSRMMRYDFFKALRRLDVDEPFGGDALRRYGYIVNEKAPSGLPIGFVVDGDSGYLGMTCATCHTAQIEYQKDNATQVLRIDGAPATANFQLFLTELTDTARKTLSDAGRFDAFAHAVLGTQYSQAGADAVKVGFQGVGRRVRQLHGQQPACLVALGPWTARRLRHDLQPRCGPGVLAFPATSSSQMPRSAIPSSGMRRSRTRRNGTAACPTGCSSMRWA